VPVGSARASVLEPPRGHVEPRQWLTASGRFGASSVASNGDLVNSSQSSPRGTRWTARAARRYGLTAKAAHMCMHGKKPGFSMFARTPCPSFVGCVRATTAPNGSPRGTRRRPGANGLLERHAMHRPPHETRIASRLGLWRRLRAACCRWRIYGAPHGQEPCGSRQELFRQYAFRLDPCLRQLAVGTPGVPRGELDGGPTGAPLTRPSAAGVRCRQPRFARRPPRNSTYTACSRRPG
jgi:hypothetical protein